MRGHRIDALRLMLITDGAGDPGRLLRMVVAAIAGGVRCVQVREPRMSTRELLDLCEELRPRLEGVEGVLLVNDRVSLAASGAAHGVHLGQRSLPPRATRGVLDACRDDAIVGLSVHDAAQLRGANGADYVILAPVFPTESHPGAPGLGPAAAAALAAATELPAVWLGGIDLGTLDLVVPHRPAGVAVMRAITAAADPAAAAAALSQALRARGI